MYKYILVLLIVLYGAKGYSQTYNPSLHLTTNKSVGIAQAEPVDARTYFYDAVNFTYRPYQNTSEVLTYLNLAKYRVGQFDIVINTGGTLNSGVITGGTNAIWYFKNGTANGDLVLKNDVVSVNGQRGVVVIGNADSIRGRTVDTTVASGSKNNYLLAYDSTNNKWKLTAPASSYVAGTGIAVTGNEISALNTSALWNAIQLRSRSISTTAPSVGQVYKWSGTAWEPSADNSALDTAYLSGYTLYLVGSGGDTVTVAINDINIGNDSYNIKGDTTGSIHFGIEQTGTDKNTKIDLNADSVRIAANNIHYTEVVSHPDSLLLVYNNNGSKRKQLKFDTTGIIVKDNIDSVGIVGANLSTSKILANDTAYTRVREVKRLISDSSSSANNGLSKSGSNIVLGQDFLDPMNPAALTGYREIPMGSNAIFYTSPNATTSQTANSYSIAGDSTNGFAAGIGLVNAGSPNALTLQGNPNYGKIGFGSNSVESIKLLPDTTVALMNVKTGLSTDSVLVKGTDGVVRKVAQSAVGTTITNAVGTGDTILISNTAKRLNAGYGIINTPSSTNITQSADTISSNSLVTQYDLSQVTASIPSTTYKWVEQFDDGIIGSNQVNGINKVFTLSATPIIGDSAFVFINGLRQVAGQDYTLSSTTLTLIDTPAKKDIISVTYRQGTSQPSTNRYLQSQTNNVVFYGNSLFYGVGAVHNFSDVVSQLRNYFPTVGFNLTNRGVPSATTTFLNARITDSLVPYLNTSYKTNTIVVTEGVNDMAFGSSPTVAYANIKTLCQNIKALNASYKVIICTILPTTSYVSNANITQVNDSIIANYSQFADTIINTTANSTIGQPGNNTNSLYYRTDGLHLFPEGYNIYASIIYPATIVKGAAISPQNVSRVILPTNDNYLVNGGNYNILADSVGLAVGNVRNYNLSIITNNSERARIDSTGKINLIPSLTARGNTTGILLSPTITGNISGVVYDAVTIDGSFSNSQGHTENLLKIKKNTDSLITIGAVTGTASLYPFKLFNTSLITPSLNLNTDLNTSNMTVGGLVFQNGAAGTGNATVIGSISQDLIYNTANNKNHLFKISNNTVFSVGSSNQVIGPYANTFSCTGTGTFPFSTKTGIIWSAPGGTGNDILIGRDGNNLYYKTHSSGSHNFTQGDNIKLYVGSNVGIGGLTSPTAYLHLSAGTATANTAPLKFTSGTPTTTPEVGSMQYNSGLWIIDSSNSVRDTIATRSYLRNNSQSALTFSTGLTNTSGTITNDLSTGKSGGGTVKGGTGSGEGLTLSSTTNATKGIIRFGSVGATSTFYDEALERVYIATLSGSPTARLHIGGGTSSAGGAPLKLTSGVNLTTPEDGAIEFDGTNYFATANTIRYTLAKTLTNTATLDFPSVSSMGAQTLTITVTGAATGDVVVLGIPVASKVAGLLYGTPWVSATNTVSVEVYNLSQSPIDPASGTFRVSIIKY